MLDPTSTAAYSAYYAKTWNRCVGLAAAMVGDRELARDLAQEGLLRLHQNWHRLPGAARWAWLRRVVRNLCTDSLRARAKAPRTLRAWEPGADDAGATEAVLAGPAHERPDEAAVQREALDGIARALDNLPRRLRCALELAMDRDGTHRERAQALGCATKTVSTRVFRARRQFARILERAG